MTGDPTLEKLDQATVEILASDAPLAERLQAFANALAELSPGFPAIVDRMIARLRSAEVGARAPQPGEPIPPFVLPSHDGKLVALDRLCAAGPVVVAFHRGQWCSYCRINSHALAELEQDLKGTSAQLVAITPNNQSYNAEFRHAARARFPVLSDLDLGYALQLDLAFHVPDDMRAALTAWGLDIAPLHNNDAWMLPIPATFVVDRNGIVQARFIDPDYRKRMAIEDILAALALC